MKHRKPHVAPPPWAGSTPPPQPNLKTANQGDYTAVANALVVAIHDVINNGVPATGFTGVPQMFLGMVPVKLIPALAGMFAKVAVDTVDQHRAAAGQ